MQHLFCKNTKDPLFSPQKMSCWVVYWCIEPVESQNNSEPFDLDCSTVERLNLLHF
ncbi:hypothetical protein OIU79_030824 [Salix purpurea]|uniref:Uncharacterized protein n=1 Tax=Salix purpurea TaxID=77065 RepID=A0A9Q0VA41_SALPP|nr:hypothetical protein OIU79_030824 [Salix purpurea]